MARAIEFDKSEALSAAIEAIWHRGVDLHPNLTQVRLVFASNVDPRIEHCPARERAGVRSDRRGHTKHHSTLASS